MGIFGDLAQSIDSVSSAAGSLFGGTGPKTNNRRYQEALRGELLKYDIGRSSYFDVQIIEKMGDVGGAGVSGPSTSGRSLTYLCHSAELPGEATATVSQKIYGVTEKFSVSTGYNDVALSFYTRGSDKEIVRFLFQKWIAYITGRGETATGIGSAKPTTYNVKYKKDYASTIKITQYSITGEPLIEVTLIDAFPIAINQVPLSWSAQNQAQSLNVVFAYTEYVYNFKSVNGAGNYAPGPLGELIGTGIQTLSTLNTLKNAYSSGNPLLATSTLPNLGLSNFTLSSGLTKIGL